MIGEMAAAALSGGYRLQDEPCRLSAKASL
jgi:hypothetical protein